MCFLSPDIAASEPIADLLLNAEESWLQRLKDPSTPLPSTDQRYDGGSHDLITPVKNLWVNYFKSTSDVLWLLHIVNNVVPPLFLSSTPCTKCASFPPPSVLTIRLMYRNPLGLSISKRDSLLEKCAMFREAGGALCGQHSQDNCLDGPFSSGASKLEQVPTLSAVPAP